MKPRGQDATRRRARPGSSDYPIEKRGGAATWRVDLKPIARKEANLRQPGGELSAASGGRASITLELRRLEEEAHKRLADLQAEFNESPEHARKVLGALMLGEKLKFSPEGGRFRAEGPLALPELLSPVSMASPGRIDTVGSVLAAARPLRFPFVASLIQIRILPGV